MTLKLLMIPVSLVSLAAAANGLTLEAYKAQVQNSDPGTKAAALNQKGAELLLNEADALTGVQLTSQFSQLIDKRPTNNPSFQGDKTANQAYSLGLKQMTDYGLSWTLTQNFSRTQISNAALTAVPVPDYYDVYPKFELNISLWRNLGGAETSKLSEQRSLLSKQQSELAKLQKLQKNIEIEEAFNTVIASQSALELQTESVARAQKILDWTKGRIARNLADASDVYQSQAAVNLRKINVVAAQVNLSKAVTKFNSLRNQSGSSQLSEPLKAEPISLSALQLNKEAQRVRKDIQIKSYENLSREAGYRVSREKFRPQLDLSLVMSPVGRDVKQDEAQAKMFEGKDYSLVALTLTMPLNQVKNSNYLEGYEALRESQKLNEQARLVDESVTWQSTADTARYLSEQLISVRELEQIQKKKADAEREKFNRGRSTLFQVLSYEQDYVSTKSQLISLELEVRKFISQLSLF